MKIKDLPTNELRQSLEATEKLLGPKAKTVQILRRELTRRRNTSKPNTRRQTLLTAEIAHAG